MRIAIMLALSLGVGGCTFSLDRVRQWRADRAVARQDFATALPLLQEIVDSQPESPAGLNAARTGARVAHLEAKSYGRAVGFYKHLVLSSPDAAERKSAQRFIAQISFENLQDFDQAVVEFERLLKLPNTPEEAFRYRMNLAKAQFRLNNIQQTLAELDVLALHKPDEDGLFEIRTLRANVLVSSHQMAEATKEWEAILKEFPERAKKEKVALNLLVCYEELKEFSKAIALLEEIRADEPNPEFLDLRIERLKERQANMPGAQGLRR